MKGTIAGAVVGLVALGAVMVTSSGTARAAARVDPAISHCRAVAAHLEATLPASTRAPVHCALNAAPNVPDAAGWYDGHVHVLVNPDTRYLEQVIAHELGHAWQAHHVAGAPRAFRFIAVRGDTGVEFPEDFADTFAWAVGHWAPIDARAWRTSASGAPTVAQVETLRTEGLLP